MQKDYVGILERKIREKTNPWLGARRRRLLKNTDFSIISNNCWAGTVYRYFGLPYQSPTAGLYFFPKDFIKFSSNLRHYTACKLEFISPLDSMHAKELIEKGEQSKLVARLDDIEIVFLHYPTEQEAAEKWYRRVSRINWDNIFIKFSQMNGCTDQDIRDFDAIPFDNKLCLTANNMPDVKSSVPYPKWGGKIEHGQILNDTDRFHSGFNLLKWLNKDPESYML